MSVNRWHGIGNLTRDPEVRSTQAGQQVVSFSLACNEQWKDKSGQKQERVEFINIVIFNEGLGRVAAEYLRKGSQCYISGKLQTRKWTGKDGNERYSTEVVLSAFNGELQLLGSPSGAAKPKGGYAAKDTMDFDDAPAVASFDDFDDKVPF